MPRRTSSLYDAKARLSSLVREARAGHSTIITVHGEPVAELIPYRLDSAPVSIEERMANLRQAGGIQPADQPIVGRPRIPVVGKAPGIVARFLADRD